MKDETTIQGLSISDGLFGDTRGDRCLLSVCKAACCRNGIWVDAEHAATIRSRAAEIRPHLPTDRGGADSWFESDEFMDHADFPSGRGIPTVVVDDPEEPGRDACVFLRPDYLCALQCAGPGLKPFDCHTYPVLRSEGEVTLDHFSPAELDGADCQRETATPRPVIEVFEGELRLCLGNDGYAELVRIARDRTAT
ncbi:MAG: DUF3109 family protein [Myxococcales bacterium]|nr:DUF3109 family protein [Myxococcales bacterium]